MRVLTTGVLTIGLVIGGCSRGDTSAAKSPDVVAPTNTAGTTETAKAPNAAALGTADPKTRSNAAWHEVTIPAGTTLPIVLDTGIGSDISRIESPVRAHLARAITIGGQTALASGSIVRGVVTEARRSGKVKGLAHVAVRFETLTPRGYDERYRIRTASIGRTAPATKEKDATKIGVPAAAGAIVGGIIGGKKGAAIGATAGGGGGAAVVMATRGKEVRLARGSRMTLRLTEPLTFRVRS